MRASREMSNGERRPTLHVIVSCKSRKTLPIPDELRVSSIALRPLKERVRSWTEALESSPAPTLPAGELYAGDHWKVVRNIASGSSAALPIKVWVASAGYGLVEFTTNLKPYSATFIRSHLESVLPKASSYSAADWWRTLAKWRPEPKLPRHIIDVATLANATGGFVLLALSEPYASAISQDITSAAHLKIDRLGVICAGLAGAAPHSVSYPEGFASTLLPA